MRSFPLRQLSLPDALAQEPITWTPAPCEPYIIELTAQWSVRSGPGCCRLKQQARYRQTHEICLADVPGCDIRYQSVSPIIDTL